jgi:hypothetical protein
MYSVCWNRPARTCFICRHHHRRRFTLIEYKLINNTTLSSIYIEKTPCNWLDVEFFKLFVDCQYIILFLDYFSCVWKVLRTPATSKLMNIQLVFNKKILNSFFVVFCEVKSNKLCVYDNKQQESLYFLLFWTNIFLVFIFIYSLLCLLMLNCFKTKILFCDVIIIYF